MIIDVANMALIPVNRDKQPLVSWKTYQKRLPTVEEIEAWKNRLKENIAGWALPTGVVSGIVALDFDGEIGIQTMRKLDLKPNVKTASGAFHVWIESPGYPVRTGAFNNRWPGMELKGDGGYVVVVGSNIRSSHAGMQSIIGNYEILDSNATSANDLDEELREFVYQAKEEKLENSIARLIGEALELCKDGRNNAGFWISCQLRDLGVSKQETLLHLTESFLPNVPAGTHHYTKQEIKKSVDSAYSRPSRDVDKAAQIDIVISLVMNAEHELWHSNNDGFVTLPDGSNYNLRSKGMKEYLSGLFFKSQKTAVTRKTIEEALDTLEAIAKMDGKLYEPYLRIGWENDTCFVDTGASYYKIDSLGYNKIEKPPVKFIRNEGMGILAEPQQGDEGWKLLRQYVNVDDTDFPLVQASVLAAYMPRGSFPVVAFTGKHASGKSTTLSAIVSVIDPRPNVVSIRDTMPKDKRNMAIIASHSCVLAFDNESHITGEISDALAMLSTGGQLKIRGLYTNRDLEIFTAKRLVIINSIGDIVTESDLLDRSIIIECPEFTQGFILDSELWSNFDRDKAVIIHAIFSAVSTAIKRVAKTKPPNIYRMTDFVKWSMASDIEGFLDAYQASTMRAPAIAISNSFIGAYIQNLANDRLSVSNQDKVRIRAEEIGRPDLADMRWVGPFASLHTQAQLSSTEWYRTLVGAINGFKRVKTDLKRIGVRIQEFQYNNQLWIAIKGYE